MKQSVLFVNITHIQQITKQTFDLAAAAYIRFRYVAKNAMRPKVLFCLFHRLNLGNVRIFSQVLFEPSVGFWPHQVVVVQALTEILCPSNIQGLPAVLFKDRIDNGKAIY